MTYCPLKRMLQALPGQNLPKNLLNPSKSSLQPPTTVTHVPIPSPSRAILEDLEGCRLGPTKASTKATKARSHVAYLIYTSGSTGTPKGAGGVVGVGRSWFFPPPPKKTRSSPPKKRSRILLGGCLPVTTFLCVCFSDFLSSKLLHPWRKTGIFVNFLVVVEFIIHFSSPRVPSKHPNDKFPNSLIEFGSVTIQFHEKRS